MSRLPRPTEAEFAELIRRRDENLAAVVKAACEKMGWEPAGVHVHASPGGCYCACPDGPCQHDWDGPEVRSDEEDTCAWASASCSRCGAVAMNHDMRCLP